MRLLLDTQVLLWWLATPERLPSRASQAIGTSANDRLLVAQARVEKLALLSADEVFERYDVRRIW